MEKGQLERVYKASGLRSQRPESGGEESVFARMRAAGKLDTAGLDGRSFSLDPHSQWGLGPGPMQPPSCSKLVLCHTGTLGL